MIYKSIMFMDCFLINFFPWHTGYTYFDFYEYSLE